MDTGHKPVRNWFPLPFSELFHQQQKTGSLKQKTSLKQHLTLTFPQLPGALQAREWWKTSSPLWSETSVLSSRQDLGGEGLPEVTLANPNVPPVCRDPALDATWAEHLTDHQKTLKDRDRWTQTRPPLQHNLPAETPAGSTTTTGINLQFSGKPQQRFSGLDSPQGSHI